MKLRLDRGKKSGVSLRLYATTRETGGLVRVGEGKWFLPKNGQVFSNLLIIK